MCYRYFMFSTFLAMKDKFVTKKQDIILEWHTKEPEEWKKESETKSENYLAEFTSSLSQNHSIRKQTPNPCCIKDSMCTAW